VIQCGAEGRGAEKQAYHGTGAGTLIAATIRFGKLSGKLFYPDPKKKLRPVTKTAWLLWRKIVLGPKLDDTGDDIKVTIPS
jgi:hypothetical protein